MKTPTTDRLEKLAEEGEALTAGGLINAWALKAHSFLKVAVGPDEADLFWQLSSGQDWESHALRVGHVQGLFAKMAADAVAMPAPGTSAGALALPMTTDSRKVFVVHGHDDEAKEKTARFLEKVGLQPIILHEQASAGRTIIEKFETYSGDIAFAVVLLTPDDVGAVAATPEVLRNRARQNVIMELGYFIGKLGRIRVCALHKGGVELPSDYQGVLYIEMDPAGAWKNKLAQELVQAKLAIDLNGILGG